MHTMLLVYCVLPGLSKPDVLSLRVDIGSPFHSLGVDIGPPFLVPEGEALLKAPIEEHCKWGAGDLE